MAMIEGDWHRIETAIARMTADEKQRLLATVSRALTAEPAAAIHLQRRRALQDLLAEMERAPVGRPADGFLNRDHDAALYGDRR